nr:C-Maf-inducing protein-like isoform X1 [Ciona intestinalis]|eukprot:XP_018670859.1 C-Maf-inducing protein-like isoform X1 [Ciona intestinalis]
MSKLKRLYNSFMWSKVNYDIRKVSSLSSVYYDDEINSNTRQYFEGTEKFKRTVSASNILTRSNSNDGQKFNLITEGSLRCNFYFDLPTSNIMEKIIHQTKTSHSWETHTICLDENEIKTQVVSNGWFKTPIPYSKIKRVIAHNKALNCVKLETDKGNYLLQASNSHQRDQWFHSLQWKVTLEQYRGILLNATSATLVQDLKLLVALAVNSHLYISDTYLPVLNIVSQLLSKKSASLSNISHEDLITALAPLVENNQPTHEICDFFIKHCRNAPRSLIVLDTFTQIVHRILKENVNFGKSSFLRLFVIEYIQALNCQNNPSEAIEKFLHRVHGPLSQCPHPRILSNLVSVCLSAIYHCFGSEIERKRNKKGTKVSNLHPAVVSHDLQSVNILNNQKTLSTKYMKNSLQEGKVADDVKTINTENSTLDMNLKESHSKQKLNKCLEETTSVFNIETMKLFVFVMDKILQIDDWGPNVAGLLQPLPFPDEALNNKEFLRAMYPLVERITQDSRDYVIKTLQHSREGKDGWLQLYSLNSPLCEDNGKLFSSMVTALLLPGVQSGKRKKFLTMLANSQLQAIITLAVRESEIMIQLLGEFLELDIIPDEQKQLQIVSTLLCTASGNKMYTELCSHRDVIHTMEGPTYFKLAPNSTIVDLQVLLGTGSWGNLRELDLSFTRPTAGIASTLSRLKNLKHLNLRFTDFNDKDLKGLCDSSLNLESLNLCETNVTDDGIQHLCVMSHLKYLNMNSTKLSLPVFTTLKGSLPSYVKYDVTYTEAW